MNELSQRDLHEKYHDAWSKKFQKTLVSAARNATRTFIFLHPAKTGGTTFSSAIKQSPNWKVYGLSDSAFGQDVCSCGIAECAGNQPSIGELNSKKYFFSYQNLLVKMGHEKYGAAYWLREQFALVGISVAEVLMTYRPIRDRLRSMFRDYWTQVDTAEAIIEGSRTTSNHVTRKVLNYYQDSRHYLSRTGQIDGLAWFKAFELHGPGMPFFLSEVFDSPIHLKEEIESRGVLLIPTAQLDNVLPKITGLATVERRRVSKPVRIEAVESALNSATKIIESLGERDFAFEEVVISGLGKIKGNYFEF